MRNPKNLLASLATAVAALWFNSVHLHAAEVGSGATTALEIILGDKVDQADPFLGDWEGGPDKGPGKAMVAQVIPRGSQTYRIHFLQAFDQRCPLFAELDGQADDGVLRFEQNGWSGRIEGGILQGTGLVRDKPGSDEPREVSFSMRKVVRLSPRLGAKPPPGALVLFDGGNLENLESDGRNGVQEITWQRLEDCLRVWPPVAGHLFGAAVRTRKAFPNFQLHLEFRLPLIAAAKGQARGNSGIIIEEFEFYEVQILDSHGLPGYWDDCGAIYTKEAPKVNACRPPGQWQSYDITYRGPKFDASGTLQAPPRITVDLNGKRVHHEVELPYSERAVQMRREKPGAKMPGRITLQHHGYPVDFRNIWIQELGP